MERMTEHATTNIVVVCENADAMGGVATFLQQFRSICSRLGYPLQVVSRFQNEKPANHGSANIYLYPPEYRSLTDRASLDPTAADEAQKVRTQARSTFKALLDSLKQPTIVLAVQAGSLLELTDLGYGPASKRQFRLLSQFHGTYEYATKQPYWNRYKRAIQQVDQIITLSQGDAEKFQRHSKAPTIAIPNLFDAPSRSIASPARKRFIFMGRLDREKSVDELILAWSKIDRQLTDWRLDIFGEGQERAALTELASSHCRSGSVTFHGRSNHPHQEFLRGGVHVMSSHLEGMPMAIMEANAAGVPTVCYDAGPGTRELVQDGVNGMIVPAGNIDRLATAMKELATDPTSIREMSRECYKHATNYTSQRIDQKWSELIEKGRSSKMELASQNVAEFDPDDLAYTIYLPQGCNTATIRFTTSSPRRPAKDLVAILYAADRTVDETLRGAVNWPWAGGLKGPYTYVPADGNAVRLTRTDTSRPWTATLRITRWGTRRYQPRKEVRALWLSCASSDRYEGASIERLVLPQRNS